MASSVLPRLRIVQESLPEGAPFGGDLSWEPRLDHGGRVCAYTSSVDGSGVLHLPGLAYFRFLAGDAEIEARPERHVSADAVTEAFHRVALPMALQASTYEVLHASAGANARGVHVLCGASRSGKSTIAYALSCRGFRVWADDAVAFIAESGRATAFPLPFTLRLRRDVADFFGVSTPLEARSEG